MIVQHNMVAMNSNRMLGLTSKTQAKSTEKLSSGYKINRAADDAAGLSISEKMRRQVRGLNQAAANAQDGISAVQTAEGALTEVHDMLQRMNELSVKGENETLATVDRKYIQQEVAQLMSEIDRVQSTTTFNEQSLLDGTFTNKGLQVGAESGQHINVTITKMDVATIGLATSKTTMQGATTATYAQFATLNTETKNAIKNVSKQRSDLGAVQNRLEHTINNLENIAENTQSAEAEIRDTNMAKEMVKFANNNILTQAGQSMLSQANQSKQGVLSLLQ